MTSLFSAIGSIASAIASFFTLKSTANRQRREAENDVAAAENERRAAAAAIKAAVHSGDDDRLNEILTDLLPALGGLALTILVGCAAAKPTVVYVPTDRRVESCTNSLGIACKAVPDAVFCELIERAQELKDLRSEMAVDKRLTK